MIDREIFSGSVDAGCVLALLFHHRDLEPDCVGVSTRGAYAWDKNTSARLCARLGKGLSTVVFHKYAPPPLPFCNLSLSTKHRGEAYMRDVTFSLAIMPFFNREMCRGGFAQGGGIFAGHYSTQ